MDQETRQIPLTKNKIAIVDEEDYARISKYTYYCHINEVYEYAGRGAYLENDRILTQIYLQEDILKIRSNKNQIILFKNGNGLDCRKENLLVVTPGQRNMAQKPVKNSISKYKGVTFCKQTGRWKARIGYNGKSLWIGRFETEEEAALAYNKRALSLYGDISFQNEIESTIPG